MKTNKQLALAKNKNFKDKFAEWWKVNGAKYDYVFPASRDAFKAGQQSRQAEVDEKDKRIEACLKTVKDKFELAKSLAQGKTTPGLSIMYETAKEMKCAVDEALRGDDDINVTR